MDAIKVVARLRATATQCLQLANTATDAEAKEALRDMALEIEASLAIIDDAQRGRAEE